MSKIKIEIEIDVDFQKFFDDIPDGVYEKKEGTSKFYELQAIDNYFNKAYCYAIENHLRWIASDNYKYAKHHCLIDSEIAKQISSNYKIISYKENDHNNE